MTARFPILTSSPWLRAPLLLLRRPGVFLAVAAASAVLAVAASSGVLFLSTVGSASLHAQAAADCPELSLPAVSASVAPSSAVAARTAGPAAFTAHDLAVPYTVEIGRAQIQASGVELLSRAGATDHIEKLSGSGGAGAWFPDDFAAKIHIRPGDRVATTTGASIRVAGIYRSLAPNPFALSELPRYWCTWHDLFDPAVVEQPTGPVLISDEPTLLAATTSGVDLSWYAPVDVGASSLPALATDQRRAGAAAVALHAEVRPDLAEKVATARSAQRGVGGPVVPIDVAGTLVAGLLVAGAGGYWAAHRSREITLLVSRGIGPGPLAVKAVLETAPAVLVGLGLGFAAALGLVSWLGPSPVLGPGVAARGLLIASAVAVAGLLVIAVIGAVAGRDRVVGSRRSWLIHVPWELALAAVAVLIGLRVRNRTDVQIEHGVVRVSTLAFVFPLLGAVAAVLLLGRLLGLALPRLAARQAGRETLRSASGIRPRGVAGYLALRRLAGSRAVAIGLLVGTALPCGLFTYADTVTSGVSHSVTAKFQTNLGAPHVLEVVGPTLGVPRLNGHGTLVAVIQIDPVLPDGTHLRILGVDPATFAAFAFTDARQRRQVAELSGPGVPAILVNAAAATDASVVTVRNSTLKVDVVARDAVFPGLRDGYQPMLVVDRDALATLDPDADRDNQVWTTAAQLPSALAALDADAGYHVLVELTSQVLIGNTGLLPVTWIFGYLKALAALVGLVAIAGLGLALAARTRRRTVAYVMSRRMGLRPSSHLGSLAVELGLVVGAGWLAGVGVGAAADAVVFRRLDLYPTLPPPSSFALSVPVLATTAAVAVLVVAMAAVGTHLLAERARPAEILRLE